MSEKSPWTIVQHDGAEWMVRAMQSSFWLVRLPERQTFMFEGDQVPAWAKVATEPKQMELVG
jgi:hypothetical protein